MEATAVFRMSKPPPRSHFWHCRWFLGRSTQQSPQRSPQVRCPALHYRNQSNITSIKKPAPFSISRTDEVYSNLIHWRLQEQRHKGQWSKVRSIETIESSIVVIK